GAPPVMLHDINPSGSASPEDLFAAVGGLMYFSADDGASGRELYRSDGTPAGTYRIADIDPGVRGSDPQEFVDYAGFVYFQADGDFTTDAELWRTDGTAAGTTLVADLNPSGDSDPTNLTVVDHGAGDRLLWMRADVSGSSRSEER